VVRDHLFTHDKELDMPVRPVFDPAHLYFVTTTAIERAPLFRRDVAKRIIADSLNYMRVNKWLCLYVFVIMPNHVHLIVRFLEGHTLTNVMRDFKKHVAKQLIRQYQAEENQQALAFLEQAAQSISGQQYKVWEDGYDARNVFSPEFLRQKAEYIHNNPCQPQWRLAERPERYAWSSARRYLLGEPAVIAVDDLREWLV
jgi:REP element-mobilizing transposase RayT